MTGSLPQAKPKLRAVKAVLAARRRKLVPPHVCTSSCGWLRAARPLRRHVRFAAAAPAITGVYVSLLPPAPVTSLAPPNIVQDRPRSKSQHCASLDARTHSLRTLAHGLSPPRLSANRALQLSPGETNGRPVPPAHRRHRPKAHSARR
jgi:hypothetical protein